MAWRGACIDAFASSVTMIPTCLTATVTPTWHPLDHSQDSNHRLLLINGTFCGMVEPFSFPVAPSLAPVPIPVLLRHVIICD
jgi:hypothetical protein